MDWKIIQKSNRANVVFNIITRSNFAVLVFILFLTQSLFAQKLNLPRHYPVVIAENQTWIGTPSGLFQYSSEDNSFKRFSLPGKDQNPEVKQMYFYNEWLWCILDSGLAALHIRLNEWLFFDSTNGLPSNTINNLTLQDDYVWIATDRGAARFDLLIEEWEIYDSSRGVPDQPVNDILTYDRKTWFILPYQFSEYDPQFEKWRHYSVNQDTTVILRRTFRLGDDIWLVSDRGLIRFNPQLQTQQCFSQLPLHAENLIELFIGNDFLWAISRIGLYYYDAKTSIWREFEGNSYLKTTNLVNAFIDPAEIWILTDQNVLVWNRSDKNWEILDYASGLSASRFRSVYASGGMVFLLNPQNIDYRVSQQDTWRKYAIRTGASDFDGSKIWKNLFDNEAGGNVNLGKYNWSWAGTRITHLRDFEQRFDEQWQAGDPATKSGERLDIKNQLTLDESRTINAFYNNIDYSETMYGVRYRSRENDVLREFNWGDYRREPGAIPFGETASVFGSNIWLQSGSKTPRFKRSQVSLKAQTGEQRSRKTYEIYQGATTQSHVVFKDTDYLKNQFYSIPDLNANERPDKIWLFVDDLIPTNNSPNTLNRQTIAGVTGDFNLWKEIEDYYYYEKANSIRFLKFIRSDWTIVVRYSLHGALHESVLQFGNIVSTALKNFYSVQGAKIIPSAFNFQIFDNSGECVPLDAYGLNIDNDDRIDSEWIDYENGLIFFPTPEPFPTEVYDPIQPTSFYSLKASFQTEQSIIQLKYRNLVRGSEIIKLDGITAVGGNDYVLDYTNGTLVFVREGLISNDTRIEIEYEYFIDGEKEQLHSAMLNWSPSDNFYLQGDWQQFADSVNQNSDSASRSDLFTIHSEIRQRAGNYDFRITPGLAFNPTEKELSAANFEGLVSSNKFRFQTIYQNYSENYNNLYNQQAIVGDIKNNLQFASTIDVRNDVRLSGEWKKTEGYAGNNSSAPSDQSANVMLLFHRQHLPGWEISYHKFKLHDANGGSDKFFVQSRLEYQLPALLSRKILVQGLKLETFLRTGKQSGLPITGSEKNQFLQGYLRLNTMISDRFQWSFFYRRNDVQNISLDNQKHLISRSERLIFDLAHEEWRAIQFNLRVENKMNQNFHNNDMLESVNLNQYSQVNMRFSPGQLCRVFSPFNFEFNLSQSVYGVGVSHENVNNWIWNFSGNGDKLSQGNISRNFFIKNEFRMSSQWFVYSLFERSAQESDFSGSSLQNYFWRWTEKLDLKLGFKTRLNFQYRQFFQNFGYERSDRYFEPSTWIEHRWTSDLQNTAYLLYRYRETEDGKIQNDSHNWESRYDLIWRKNQMFRIRRWEIRQSFSGNHNRTYGNNPGQTYQLTSSSSIDLYPLHSMIFRLRFDFSQFIDGQIRANDYFDLGVNLKFSLRF